MRLVPIAVYVALLTACSHVPRATEDGVLKDFWSNISSDNYIRVRGVGSPPDDAHGPTRRRALSRQAALAAARYQLLSIVRGVRLSGGITVSQLVERDSLIRELADDLVAGGEEIATEWTKEDSCVATLELKRSTVERLIQRKSAREKDLEQRVSQDLDEIKRLNGTLEAMADRSVGPDWNENAQVEFYVVNDLARRLKRMKRDGLEIDTEKIKKMIEEDTVEYRAWVQLQEVERCRRYPSMFSCPRQESYMRQLGQ